MAPLLLTVFPSGSEYDHTGYYAEKISYGRQLTIYYVHIYGEAVPGMLLHEYDQQENS